MEDQERNEKLALWRGFKKLDKPYDDGVYGVFYWEDPDGNLCRLSNFKDSVDLCFKWLVPELNKRGYYYELFQWNNNEHKAVIIKPTKYWADIIASAIADTPALALGKVIGQVIDNE